MQGAEEKLACFHGAVPLHGPVPVPIHEAVPSLMALPYCHHCFVAQFPDPVESVSFMASTLPFSFLFLEKGYALLSETPASYPLELWEVG